MAGSHCSAPPSSPCFRRRTTVSHGSRRSSTHSEVDLCQPPQFPHHLHADRVLFFTHLLPLRFASAHHSNITHPITIADARPAHPQLQRASDHHT
ncbi:hypothetical protein DEO72_LG10g1530 [Vigna unguiculata]|uniref:Uncharacterized protein n=1 Tax=Vigna unguiculata TaxID=3917 RepID=A0A4D6NBN5_VIGUN|nr:hypothetical protein DEO72_LG10g1530 [Vigna unguiculata]